MTLGEKLRRLREDKGLKQNEAAVALGISNVNLNRYETDKHDPDLDTIIKLSNFYDVSTDYLLGKCADLNTHSRPATLALSRSDNPEDDLPEEALKQLEDYIGLLRLKYKKKAGLTFCCQPALVLSYYHKFRGFICVTFTILPKTNTLLLNIKN